MAIVWSVLASLAGLISLFVAAGIYFAGVLRWADEQTLGINYYGLPPAERDAFKRKLAFHARLLRPMIWLTSRKTMDFRKGRIQHKGVSAPSDSCSAEGFAKAEA